MPLKRLKPNDWKSRKETHIYNDVHLNVLKSNDVSYPKFDQNNYTT